MKTSELTGAQLDCWVAKAEGRPHWVGGRDGPEYFSPSTNWAQGGPIIEREAIPVRQLKERHFPNWQAGSQRCFGPTPLVAAMRCYVVSKFGDEVPAQAESN